MKKEIRVKYSRDIIKIAVWKFWTRSISVAGFVAFGVVSLAFGYLLIIGDRSWVLGFAGAVFGLALIIGVLSYFIYLNRSLEKFQRMEQPIAVFRFSDEGIGIQSDNGTTELSWKMIDKVWKYPSVWLVFIAKQGYVTLPCADLDDEIKQFITLKVAKKYQELAN